MSLRACMECRRHFGSEPVCPFCGATAPAAHAERPAVVGRLSRAAVFASGVLAGCWTGNAPPQEPPPPPTEHAHQPPPPDEQKLSTAPGVTATSGIEGIVTDADTGGPRANHPVYLHTHAQSVAGDAKPAMTAITDANGHYVFRGLRAGSYIVTFGRTSPRAAMHRSVTLADHDVKRVDYVLPMHRRSHLPMPYGAPPARTRVV